MDHDYTEEGILAGVLKTFLEFLPYLVGIGALAVFIIGRS